MGAANALAAYQLYGGKVPPASMNALAYMALVALDKDGEPCWWEGHEMLAIRCFGYPEPVTDAARRAVRRAITPLFQAGAITATRHGSASHGRLITVRYRLWLEHPAPDGNRPKQSAVAQDGNRPKQASCIGRKTAVLRTESVRAQDGNRPTKEEEEEEERDIGVAVIPPTVEGSLNGAAPSSKPDIFDAERMAFGRLAPERQARLLELAVNQLGKDTPNAEIIRAAYQLAETSSA